MNAPAMPWSAPPLSRRLREATRTLHTEVERCGVMARLLRGALDRPRYARLLASLLPIYEALEQGLARHRGRAVLAPWADAGLARAAHLRADLERLQQGAAGPAVAPVPAALDHAAHLRALSVHAPDLLAAHAYVRYLGDLNGGQLLARRVGEQLGLASGEAVSFHAFGGPDAVQAQLQRLRAALDDAGRDEALGQALVDEACAAFARHRPLFEQIDAG